MFSSDSSVILPSHYELITHSTKYNNKPQDLFITLKKLGLGGESGHAPGEGKGNS